MALNRYTAFAIMPSEELEVVLTTLDAVPPGQQESSIKPTVRDGERPNSLLTIHPNEGIIVY